jgi:integrase
MVHIAGTGRGTYRIDRRFPGIGRINKSTGTLDVKTFKQIDAMLTQFYETGKLEILQEIKEGAIRVMDVYSRWHTGELDKIPSAAILVPLSSAMMDWNSKRDVTEHTKYNTQSIINRFIRAVGDGEIKDVPVLLGKYREHCIKIDQAASFNIIRRRILTFIADRLQSTHPLYKDVRIVKTLKEKSKRQAKQFTVPKMMQMLKQLPPAHRGMARTLLMTGMGWGEYTGEWKMEMDRVLIHGKKTKHRDRVIPRFEKNLEQPCRVLKVFTRALKKVEPTLSPYSFRRTFANWLAEAGSPIWRRNAYMGHSVQTMTELYEKGEVERYFQEDVKKLTKYIEKELKGEVKKVNTPTHSAFQVLTKY